MGNFHARRVLAEQLKKMADEEVGMRGAAMLNLIDAVNKPLVKAAIDALEGAERKEWVLTQAFSKTKDGSRLADKADRVILKGKKAVAFCSNDLAEAPAMPFSSSHHSQAARRAHGVAKISRWVGQESSSRAEFMAPAIIAACNFFMNCVDGVHQLAPANPTRRKEKGYR